MSKQSGTPQAPGRSVEPDDAHRGTIAPMPHDNAEAKADRDMATAERAVAMGSASADEAAAVDRMAMARSHEERRKGFMANSAS